MLGADFGTLSHLEWLETNGRGGYASGTVSGAGTRGYHGLLAAAFSSPAQRMMLVTTCDEWLVDAEPQPQYLSSHQYPGAVSPGGWRFIEEFSWDPFPTWRFAVGARRIERRIFMVHGENATVMRYRLIEGAPVRLAVRPFFVFRDHHARRVASDGWRVVATRVGGVVHCVPSDGKAALSLAIGDAKYRAEPLWYRNFEYLREMERGLSSLEDAFAPFVLELSLTPGRWCDLVFSAEGRAATSVDALEEAERARRTSARATANPDDELDQRLTAAADAFLVSRGASGRSVIAGYHWFGDWGRDAMISLPGLTLATGRLDDAHALLTTWASHMCDGLLPNRFADDGTEPEYNTVDAGLWFVVAVHHLWRVAGDAAVSDGVLATAVEGIVRAYATGTRFGIREDADGLVTQGEEGLALTWMDARVNGVVVTPRRGKAVEINALWYNARRILAELQRRSGAAADADETVRQAQRTAAAFRAAFWDPKRGALIDVIAPDGTRDGSVRPNQLFAASLPYPLLTREQAARMLEEVTRELLTPCGLRTLARSDANFRTQYEGNPEARDYAYHQGSVWPWLLGAYVDAEWYAQNGSEPMRARVRESLGAIAQVLDQPCAGQLSEIFDGAAPHAARGCVAQAWSVAEVLRAWRRVTRKTNSSNTGATS